MPRNPLIDEEDDQLSAKTETTKADPEPEDETPVKAAKKPAARAARAADADEEDDPPAKTRPARKESEGAYDPIMDERVWLILEDSKNIPPTGQFFGLNGRTWILRAGEPAHVPQAIVNLLDDAIEARPVFDTDGQKVIGYRDVLRFNYRIITEQQAKKLMPRQVQAA